MLLIVWRVQKNWKKNINNNVFETNKSNFHGHQIHGKWTNEYKEK